MAIPLCVPFSAKAAARAAGATWNIADKLWECDAAQLDGGRYAALHPFLPRMYRRDSRLPFIRPFMVPQTSWGKNLRAVLDDEQWRQVRQHAYDATGRRCTVCGGRGPEWPVEADEAWAYDDEKHLQTLKGVIPLCPPCHLVRHWGRATTTGQAETAIAQMMHVNGWSRGEAEDAGEEGFALWRSRSRRTWSIDYSWVTRIHGIAVAADGLKMAEDANRRLVLQAQADHGTRPW